MIAGKSLTADQLRRNQNSVKASGGVTLLRERTDHMSVDQLGKYLIANQITFGNCYEMSATAAQHCLVSPELRGKMKHLWVLGSDQPGDHVVVVLSNGPDRDLQKHRTVGDVLAAQGGKGLYVVDCWANVACGAESYQRRLEMKLDTWSKAGKVIAKGYIASEPSQPISATTINSSPTSSPASRTCKGYRCQAWNERFCHKDVLMRKASPSVSRNPLKPYWASKHTGHLGEAREVEIA
jgi:hypothetical protein